MNWIIDYEALLRVACFATILLAMLVWESRSPCRQNGNGGQRAILGQRRLQHLSLTVFNSLALRLLPFIAAVKASHWAANENWGLFNWLGWSMWLTVPLSMVLLDLVIYFQHRVFHAVPVLWRLHRLHHSDADFDTTTALRFHPFEILLSMLIKFAFVMLLGAPIVAVILFEIVLNGSALFNHGNVRLSPQLERTLRALFVTPDMHRVHHSVIRCETDSNFGFNLSCWDRLFGTYRAQPAAGHTAMKIGLLEFPRATTRRFRDLLLQPWYQAAPETADTPSSTN